MAGDILSLSTQLWNLLTKEYDKFQGVEDQVAKLKSDLNLLTSFMQDANKKKHTKMVVRNCVEEIKEIIFDAEDIIETFLLKEKLGETSIIKKPIVKLGWYRRSMALDIEGISNRITKVIGNMTSFGVQQDIGDGTYLQALHDNQWEVRQTFPMESESDCVGLEENVNKLIGYLLDEDSIQVVSITGMGGLGKTTLARQVFNHELIKNKFDGHAWVCVSQDFTRKTVWQLILQDLRPKEEENRISQMTEPTLQREIFQLLKASKTLIVLDDIWTNEAWVLIKDVFPTEKGCKVLFTSRNDNVLSHGNRQHFNFKLGCLTEKDSWTLFQKIVLPSNDASGKHSTT